MLKNWLSKATIIRNLRIITDQLPNAYFGTDNRTPIYTKHTHTHTMNNCLLLSVDLNCAREALS